MTTNDSKALLWLLSFLLWFAQAGLGGPKTPVVVVLRTYTIPTLECDFGLHSYSLFYFIVRLKLSIERAYFLSVMVRYPLFRWSDPCVHRYNDDDAVWCSKIFWGEDSSFLSNEISSSCSMNTSTKDAPYRYIIRQKEVERWKVKDRPKEKTNETGMTDRLN